MVVPSVNGWSDLEGVLDALAGQTGGVRVQVIVVDRVGSSVRGPLRTAHPGVVLLEAPPTETIPRMRARAFKAADAEIVGVIEDHVIVPPDWAERMLEAHGRGAVVVGGSVENAARERLVDWAAFLCEYSHCLSPPVGVSDWLTGNNVTYRRRILEAYAGVIDEGRWENRLHDALRADGVELLSRPDIRVGHKKHYTVREYLSQRYLYARSYAGMRVRGQGRIRRLAWGFAAFPLPPLLFGRTVRKVLEAGRHRAELARSLPLIGLFVTSWAAGEVVGYWAGAGDALRRVR